MRFKRAIILCLIGLVASCAIPNTHYDAQQTHHTPTGFKANYQIFLTSSLGRGCKAVIA